MSKAVKQSGPTTRYGRQIVYDRELFISICRRLLEGEDLRDICAKPPMPIGPVFLGWIQDHPEARAIYRSVQNFESDSELAKELRVPWDARVNEWENRVRANCERGWPADYMERKYIPPDWQKVYPLVGVPLVWSTENIEAYTELLNGFTEMLEPRDMMELMLTKEAADATWEAGRKAREKNSLPERKYQQRMQVVAETRRRNGAADATAAKPATALDHSRGLEGGFKYYAALDIAQSRAIKRRDNALRQIARWRDGLGAKARHLSDKFIAEEALAEHYDAAHLLADAETDNNADEAMEAAPPLAPAGDAAETAPPLAPAGGAAEAAPPPAPKSEAADAAPPLAAAGDAAGAAPSLAPKSEAVEAATPLAAWGDPADAAPPLAPAGGAAEAAPLLASKSEAVEAATPLGAAGDPANAALSLAPAGGAAEAAPPPAPAGDESINWVGWLTGKDRYEWYRVSNAARKDFKQLSTSKRWLVQHLVLDRKVIRPDQVCPELAEYLPAIAEAAPTLTASVEAPQ